MTPRVVFVTSTRSACCGSSRNTGKDARAALPPVSGLDRLRWLALLARRVIGTVEMLA